MPDPVRHNDMATKNSNALDFGVPSWYRGRQSFECILRSRQCTGNESFDEDMGKELRSYIVAEARLYSTYDTNMIFF